MTSDALPAASSSSAGRPAVFLDRDGTMNEDVGYLSELSHLTLYPWAIDAVRLFNHAGYAVVVITNQGGIGRGMIRPEFVGELHAEIAAPHDPRRRARRRLVPLPAPSGRARRGAEGRLPLPQAGARDAARRGARTWASIRRARG